MYVDLPVRNQTIKNHTLFLQSRAHALDYGNKTTLATTWKEWQLVQSSQLKFSLWEQNPPLKNNILILVTHSVPNHDYLFCKSYPIRHVKVCNSPNHLPGPKIHLVGTVIFRLPVKRNRKSVWFFTFHVKIHEIHLCKTEFMFLLCTFFYDKMAFPWQQFRSCWNGIIGV